MAALPLSPKSIRSSSDARLPAGRFRRAIEKPPRPPYNRRVPPPARRPKGRTMTERADFRQFYRDAHGADLLTDREKRLMGLAVAIARNCQP